MRDGSRRGRRAGRVFRPASGVATPVPRMMRGRSRDAHRTLVISEGPGATLRGVRRRGSGVGRRAVGMGPGEGPPAQDPSPCTAGTLVVHSGDATQDLWGSLARDGVAAAMVGIRSGRPRGQRRPHQTTQPSPGSRLADRAMGVRRPRDRAASPHRAAPTRGALSSRCAPQTPGGSAPRSPRSRLRAAPPSRPRGSSGSTCSTRSLDRSCGGRSFDGLDVADAVANVDRPPPRWSRTRRTPTPSRPRGHAARPAGHGTRGSCRKGGAQTSSGSFCCTGSPLSGAHDQTVYA